MKKRMILTIVSLILVAIISVMGTLAYLTDSEMVTNTFTIGRVNIVLDEANVDEDGKLIIDDAGNPVNRVKENEYHLIPGQSYTKDPTITVQPNSEEAYIRIIMTVHNASTVQAILDDHQLGDFSALIGGWDKEVWIYEGFKVDTEADTISFEFRYMEPVGAGIEEEVLPALFDTLLVPGEVNGEELQRLYDPNGDGSNDDGFKMVIVGHAIQKAGFDDADAAWEVFEKQTAVSAQTVSGGEAQTDVH